MKILAYLLAGFAVILCSLGIGPVDFATAAPDNGLGTAIMSAAVYFDGTLIRGSGALSVIKNDVGVYFVQFDRNVRFCFKVATLSSDNQTLQTGSAATTRGLQDDTIIVGTTNPAGTYVDRTFQVLVFCNE